MSIVEELYSKIEDGRSGKNIGLSTGLPKLDRYTGGFKKGVYKLVFSRSSVGKTRFVIYSDIYHILNDKRPFGLSLSEMYSASYMLQKNSAEYAAYQRMLESKDVMALNYKELSRAMFAIKANNITETYYSTRNFAKTKLKNYEKYIPEEAK